MNFEVPRNVIKQSIMAHKLGDIVDVDIMYLISATLSVYHSYQSAFLKCFINRIHGNISRVKNAL